MRRLTREEIETLEEVDRRFAEHKRWHVVFDVVVKKGASYYRYRDHVPATEMQESDDKDFVEVTEVVPAWARAMKWIEK